jgi:hypothetical protein
MKEIVYLNIGYFTKLYNHNYKFNQSLSTIIRDYINQFIIDIENTMFFIDFENINFIPIQDIDISQPKKTPIYFAFSNLIINATNSLFVFINCDKFTKEYILVKDFCEFENVIVISSKEDSYTINPISKKDILKSQISFLSEFLSFEKPFSFDSFEEIIELKEKLFSYQIKKMILKNKVDCIVPTTEKNHILKSTSVHVNEYINIKPLIEQYSTFSEISFLLSENILAKMSIPDFLVASSKNSFALASGISFFLNCDITIINQVSPITAFNNFSTLDKINPDSRYAIIEDFFCMGTEMKVIKGILWSKGVNIYENVYMFPVASTRLYDNDKTPMTQQKIYPLYKIDNDLNYKIFTYNTCPVCNDIHCYHRELFNF